MGIFGSAANKSGSDSGAASGRGANGNVRDTGASAKHVALSDQPHTDATRRSDHQPKHSAK